MTRKTAAKAGMRGTTTSAPRAPRGIPGRNRKARLVPTHRALQIWIPGTSIIISALALIVERYRFPTDSVFWFCVCAIIGGAVSILSVRGLSSN